MATRVGVSTPQLVIKEPEVPAEVASYFEEYQYSDEFPDIRRHIFNSLVDCNKSLEIHLDNTKTAMIAQLIFTLQLELLEKLRTLVEAQDVYAKELMSNCSEKFRQDPNVTKFHPVMDLGYAAWVAQKDLEEKIRHSPFVAISVSMGGIAEELKASWISHSEATAIYYNSQIILKEEYPRLPMPPQLASCASAVSNAVRQKLFRSRGERKGMQILTLDFLRWVSQQEQKKLNRLCK